MRPVVDTSVLALGSLGVAAIAVVVNALSGRWTGRNAREQQREERDQQRRSSACVKLLELAEKEGHYL